MTIDQLMRSLQAHKKRLKEITKKNYSFFKQIKLILKENDENISERSQNNHEYVKDMVIAIAKTIEEEIGLIYQTIK